MIGKLLINAWDLLKFERFKFGEMEPEWSSLDALELRNKTF